MAPLPALFFVESNGAAVHFALTAVALLRAAQRGDMVTQKARRKSKESSHNLFPFCVSLRHRGYYVRGYDSDNDLCVAPDPIPSSFLV